MQINIPKIVKRIELKNYAPEFGEAALEVWVNPPGKLLDLLRAAKKRVYDLDIPKRKLEPNEKAMIEKVIQESWNDQAGLYAQLLSQGSEETRLGVGELNRMVEETAETDPMFWGWLQAEIVEMINAHRFSAKKG
jgi:hypothetical protein